MIAVVLLFSATHFFLLSAPGFMKLFGIGTLVNLAWASLVALAVEAAMWAVNDELRAWQHTQLEAGHSTLAAVPAIQLGGESIKARQYRRAIYCHVQAQLAEAYRDMETLPSGAAKEQRVLSALEIRVDSHHQQLRWAIADLQGLPRTIVELL